VGAKRNKLFKDAARRDRDVGFADVAALCHTDVQAELAKRQASMEEERTGAWRPWRPWRRTPSRTPFVACL
jgi:hypothetical protein